MTSIDWMGYTAATFTTTAFIPQVWKIWRTRHTKDISLLMYTIFTGGVAMWLIYGILIESWPIIMANALTVCLAGSVLLMKVRFG